MVQLIRCRILGWEENPWLGKCGCGNPSSGSVSGKTESKQKSIRWWWKKSPAKELGRSLRKSFRCVPTKDGHKIPQFPETPEKTLDLSYIVPPPTPPTAHNGFHETGHSRASLDAASMDSCGTSKSPSKVRSSMDSYRGDDEHRLIARYTACLASNSNGLVSHKNINLFT
ncbi:hypothetical protein NP493_109g00018 [Ridgeia piscesae]|uniref:Uncharacterized protein n=1 Tax=Ridgeia piscesae TaxID=27915 RepID=A0AAD9UH37_RIDPI|nr:hypothetical protein NP493_109g00018 [Ridgeia piscesae]